MRTYPRIRPARRIVVMLMAVLLFIGLAACKQVPVVNDTPPDVWTPSPGDEALTQLSVEPGQSAGPSVLPADGTPEPVPELTFRYEDVPAYDGSPWIEINGSTPYFTGTDLCYESFESYAELDGLGRCGTAYACLGQDLMPTEARGDISGVKPSGWHTVRYDDLIADKYLYNRCHLIGHQLAGEDANERNLVTGTRAMNIDGMLPFENQVADYVETSGNHVLYRVTPVFLDDELVCRGVLMEGYSVEDMGYGICFCVFAYNNQPGVVIDYATGESEADPDYGKPREIDPKYAAYVLNEKTRKFHLPGCEAVTSMSAQNRRYVDDDRAALVAQGYLPCGACNP